MSWHREQVPLPHAPLVPRLRLGTHLSGRLRRRSRSRAREGVEVHRLIAAATSQREMEFRGVQRAFPDGVWERSTFGNEGRAVMHLTAHRRTHGVAGSAANLPSLIVHITNPLPFTSPLSSNSTLP